MSSTTARIITAAPDINSDGIVAWGVRNIIPVVLLVIGIAIIAGAGLLFGFADNIASFVFARS